MKKYFFLAGLFSTLLFSCGKDKDPKPQTNSTQNTFPVTKDDVASLTEGTSTSIEVLANDSDQDNHTLIISSAKLLSGKGTVTIANDKKTINISTAIGDVGTTVIEYSISDGNGGSATGKATVTVKAKQVVYENFINFNGTSYTPSSGGWVQAGVFGYDELTITQDINSTNFESRFVRVRISRMFDYWEDGEIFTLTTKSSYSDLEKGEVYIEFVDQSGGLTKTKKYPALEGQTIKLTVTNAHATGINGYIEIENINLSGGNTLSAKSKR
jgi:hypothetical protein